jgi:hypothetical protein
VQNTIERPALILKLQSLERLRRDLRLQSAERAFVRGVRLGFRLADVVERIHVDALHGGDGNVNF